MLIVEKLQELRSIRIQKLKKQGEFFSIITFSFLDLLSLLNSLEGVEFCISGNSIYINPSLSSNNLAKNCRLFLDLLLRNISRPK